ncbi:hypothetical protein FKW77_006412 [Venturia effusa]|uniref:DUF7587 domain-containing protein n=1 Tax=Venturia effusa TaxID=50376 RepID=A0A517KZL2_9PEZI|nr:hypothetical protein FKW77_006412 [Venturia effusa]
MTRSKNVPASRRASSRKRRSRNEMQIVLYGGITKSRRSSPREFKPAIDGSSLRSAWSRDPRDAGLDDSRDEDAVSAGEPVTSQFSPGQRAPTPFEPRTPPRVTPQRKQKQKTSPIQSGLLTPPNSGSSSRIQKATKKAVSKKRISNFRATLAAVVIPQVFEDTSSVNDDVQIASSQVNISFRAPGHMWKTEERQCLILLKRFFVADVIAITTLLNAVFPKALVPFKSNMVSVQYAEIAGGKNSSEDQDSAWDYVWTDEDFGSACREFHEILEALEEKASESGVAITRRIEEDRRNITQVCSRIVACQNRPPRTPRTPRRIVEEPNTKKRMIRPLRSQSSATLGRATSQTEIYRQPVAAPEIIPSIEIQSQQNGTYFDLEVPTLLFRAYSNESAGTNGAEGFRATQFIGLPHSVPPPLDPSTQYFAWNAANHLSPSRNIANKIATPFISLSPSLVWCVQRLYKMGGEDDSKELAVIDGPMADAKTRVYKTGPIMSQLKRTDMYWKGVRYQAKLEYFAWAEIDQEAISTVIGRRHLETLAAGSASVRSVLRLDILKTSDSVKAARTQFIANPIPLDGKTGMAIGNLCLLFGISFHSDQAVITEMVFHILQGWAIKIDIEDEEARQQAFSCFIGQLEKNDCSIGLSSAISILRPKMRDAFERGVQQAAQALLKDKASRPDQRKRRNRRALDCRV